MFRIKAHLTEKKGGPHTDQIEVHLDTRRAEGEKEGTKAQTTKGKGADKLQEDEDSGEEEFGGRG